jgi:hypothetical protein
MVTNKSEIIDGQGETKVARRTVHIIRSRRNRIVLGNSKSQEKNRWQNNLKTQQEFFPGKPCNLLLHLTNSIAYP